MDLLYVSNQVNAERPSAVQLAADTISDAIKTGLVASAKQRTERELNHSIQSIKVTATEITWYLNTLYAPDEIKALDKKLLTETVFENLLIERRLPFKGDCYTVTGVQITEGKRIKKLIGIELHCKSAKAKPKSNVEPELQ